MVRDGTVFEEFGTNGRQTKFVGLNVLQVQSG